MQPASRPLLDVLDELERRHRRDYEQVRDWLFSATKSPDGPISVPALDEAHNRYVVPLLLDYEDVADALQVSPTTVKRLVRSGDLPAVKVARTTRVRRCDLDAYVEHLSVERPTCPTPKEPRMTLTKQTTPAVVPEPVQPPPAPAPPAATEENKP